jgi:hypothetical protein
MTLIEIKLHSCAGSKTFRILGRFSASALAARAYLANPVEQFGRFPAGRSRTCHLAAPPPGETSSRRGVIPSPHYPSPLARVRARNARGGVAMRGVGTAFRSSRFVFHPGRIVSRAADGRVAHGKSFTFLNRYMVGRMFLAVIAAGRNAFLACFSLHLDSPRSLRSSRI